MRTSMAYFAGAGTVIVAIVAGLGGGLVIANMVNPQPAKQGIETSVMERRRATEPVVAVKVGPSEPVQYLAAPALPAPTAAAPVMAPQNEAANSAPSVAPPAAVTAAAPTAQPVPPAAEPSTSAAQEPRRVASQEGIAKAQEADIKRDAEAKRLMEKRKVERERRQQWADKRRTQPRQEQDLRDVEDKVREVTERGRDSGFERVGVETPQIRLFGSE
jgi:hypothetical protein